MSETGAFGKAHSALGTGYLDQQQEAGIAEAQERTKTGKDRAMQLICIEGNIGSGKSMLTKELARVMGAKAMFEPVDENPYLDKFYADPKRYALEMQFWLMSHRFEMHEKAIRHIWRTGQSVIMDRSIYGDWIFAKKNWLDGNIDSMGYASYLKHRAVMDQYLLAPHVMLFLEVSTPKCLERIQERGRDCEKTIPADYLQGLYKLHDELALEMRQRGTRNIHLDWHEYLPAEKVMEKIRA